MTHKIRKKIKKCIVFKVCMFFLRAGGFVNWDKTGSVKENKTKLSVVLIITV
jgi:hypothetical protein